MIVASIYAPRFEKWGADYDELLKTVDASCRRLGLRHICISDSQRPVETFQCDLPENLMQALLAGQLQFLQSTKEAVLFIGADCVLTRDPRPYAKGDMTVTVGPFEDCPLNTGAIWVNKSEHCQHIWHNALKKNPEAWGDDQRVLYMTICHAMIKGWCDVQEIAAIEHNWAPDSADDPAGMPTVAHFRGERKSFMAEWYRRHVADKQEKAA